ncbi:long-chain-fatty-acid--CoA ligase [Paraburkholderia sp. USG1]|uniref:long-chain-fatty-acid--CoA ligase n=1 Tax=Paraburkholderia sp. USG1 TaxID=2952268 RepID=UPI0028653633|nr:long-chain-fatty-acid--CoA ligase [Paraburkholderia sp. USG1]MDR8398388.1 long-chain-fatty-acid--CoA ligase [Paraburkholderia sp. USG1]
MWLFSEIRSLGDIPRHYARTIPEKPALIDADGTVSFAELDARSNRLANALVRMGIEPGARVAFLGRNSSRFFEVWFGVNKAALALVPLNWRLAVVEMAAIVEDASPALIITDREYEGIAEIVRKSSTRECRSIVFDSTSPGTSGLDELMNACHPADPAIQVDPWQIACLMYTSGTTGRPKGVQLSHQGYLYLRLCEHLDSSLKYDVNDVMLTVMPLFHAMGTGLSLQALYNGAAVAVYSMPEPGELIKLIARDRPTILPLVPTVIQMLLEHPDAAVADYSSVRFVICAGSPIGSHLLSRAIRAMQCDFIQFYGATETSTGVTFLRPEQHRLDDEAKLRSCGSPLPLVEIKVVDAKGKEVPNGQVGELLIRSPSLATGYFNQPELTAATFGSGWYRSGDGGYRDAEGFFYIVDRLKDMIISGGENVYSAEVEQALQRLPGVDLCAAVGLPDEKWGERVVAAIVLAPSATLSKEEVISHCRGLIAGYKVPKQVEFVQSMPMTSTGKVMKRALRDLLLKDS